MTAVRPRRLRGASRSPRMRAVAQLRSQPGGLFLDTCYEAIVPAHLLRDPTRSVHAAQVCPFRCWPYVDLSRLLPSYCMQGSPCKFRTHALQAPRFAWRLSVKLSLGTVPQRLVRSCDRWRHGLAVHNVRLGQEKAKDQPGYEGNQHQDDDPLGHRHPPRYMVRLLAVTTSVVWYRRQTYRRRLIWACGNCVVSR